MIIPQIDNSVMIIMKKDPQQSILRLPVIIVTCFFFLLSTIQAERINQKSSSPVKLRVMDNHVEIDNGIVTLTLLNPSGSISGVGYHQVDNVLEYRFDETRRGYWDTAWSRPGQDGHFDKLDCTSFRVVAESEDQVEVSFTKAWNASYGENTLPLNIDKRYILLRGVSGFYTYAIFEHLSGWPDMKLSNARVALKLHQDMFYYMAISDDMQKVMPSKAESKAGRRLDYKEATLLANPSNPVEDKYQYSCDNKDNHVHGWISSNPSIGLWVITPSDEFRAGGPVKQDLTSHAASTSLAIFFSGHYADWSFGVQLQNGEEWKKVFGPVFIYLNSDSSNRQLWKDAKRQMLEETKKWPYNFPMSKDFAHANQRGTVTGRLLVHDRYTSNGTTAANSAYVGLALPGDVGSWQYDSKGYQFWTRSDARGRFVIANVRAGTYSLYAWVPGIIGDFKYETDIVIKPGTQVGVGKLVYYPPRNGPTLWEIGIPDRTAAEFYVPDPPPGLANNLFMNQTLKYRQYGLWYRYTDLYPHQDLVYTVGVSDYRKDWFFAHVNRKVGNSYKATTWKIVFNARNVIKRGSYTLRLALASAHSANIQVWMNSNPMNGSRPHFETGRIGKDNVIARHGIHGLYRLYNATICGSMLQNGTNLMYLKQSKGSYPFDGVLYDYIRLEAPPTPNYIVN